MGEGEYLTMDRLGKKHACRVDIHAEVEKLVHGGGRGYIGACIVGIHAEMEICS